MSSLTRLFTGLLAAVSIAAQETSQWWAYRPLERPAVPSVRDAQWARSAIDQFILARLEAAGLSPSEPADRYALLRRVTYDLTGLPPTAAEIEFFIRDNSPDAYEQAVDRLLASEQYGVKWGRHWLDLVRYAETDGYERDRNKPYIWRYRDWVVDALNADMAYGEFLTRQLAGDELPNRTVGDQVATGFYRLGIWDDEPTDPRQARYDDLDGIADTTARVMLGISMGCARCHDHKRDPLPTKDYYAFLSFFENIETYDLRSHAVPTDGAVDEHAAALSYFERRSIELTQEISAAADAAWAAVPEARRNELIAAGEAALVARYSGDDLHATELRDQKGSAHGKIEGQIAPIEGRYGGAMRFDGDDAAVLPRLVEESFTVSFFVRSTHRGRGDVGDPRWFLGSGLVDGEVPGIVRDWGISWHSEGRIVAGSGQPETFLASPTGYHDGEWHHVAFTRDRGLGSIALFVDGVLVESKKGTKKVLDSPPNIVVGRLQPGGGGFRGDIDELRFYGRALGAAEVVALALDLPGGIAAPAIVNSVPAATGDAADRTKAFAELQRLERPNLRVVEVLAVRELTKDCPPSFVRMRGNVHAKGDPVGPSFPQMLGAAAPEFAPVPDTSSSSGRRTALAKWITGPDNRLTWRVIANRLWQFHFGRGLSRSPNDFGRLGEAPTHPELLDWLACEVKAQGGSLKAMHRIIATSAAYRMASSPRTSAYERDPQNDLFWRFDRRRLTAEEIRDTILATSGELNLKLGGPWIYPPLPKQVLATASRPDAAWGRSAPGEAVRRSLYVHIKRSLQEPLLATFDQADTDNSCPVRFATVQASQALVLLNSDFSQQRAGKLASRLERSAPTLAARIELGLALVTQRPARNADRDRMLALHGDLVRDYGRSPAEALQRVCLVLLNCNELIYID